MCNNCDRQYIKSCILHNTICDLLEVYCTSIKIILFERRTKAVNFVWEMYDIFYLTIDSIYTSGGIYTIYDLTINLGANALALQSLPFSHESRFCDYIHSPTTKYMKVASWLTFHLHKFAMLESLDPLFSATKIQASCAKIVIWPSKTMMHYRESPGTSKLNRSHVSSAPRDI